MLASEQFAGAPEPHRDFVGDEVDVVTVAEFAQQHEELGIVHAHAAGALHERLDDDRGDFIMAIGEECCDLGDTSSCDVDSGLVRCALIGVGRVDRDHIHQQRAIDRFIELHVTDRQRAECFAVIAVAQRDEASLARPADILPIVKTHLHRDFDRSRATVGKEATIETLRCAAGEFRRKLRRRFVREAGEHGVWQRRQLTVHGLVDVGMRMPPKIHPPRADGIEVAFAIGVFQPSTAPTAQRHQWQLRLVVLHLGARVPHVGEVEFSQFGRGERQHAFILA
mgnify:CR=1 FL=1